MDPCVRRLSHIVYCVRPENFDAATTMWSAALGVNFDHIELHDGSVRVAYSLDNGIEVIAPSSTGPTKFWDFLDQHGEGVYTVVYVVPDLGEAEAALADHGLAIVDRLVYTGRRPWSEEWATLEERVVEPTCGMRITIARMERHPDESA